MIISPASMCSNVSPYIFDMLEKAEMSRYKKYPFHLSRSTANLILNCLKGQRSSGGHFNTILLPIVQTLRQKWLISVLRHMISKEHYSEMLFQEHTSSCSLLE